MKKLILGFALVMFLGTYSVSASSVIDNPPAEKPKTEAKASKKECSDATAEKKAECKDKATTASAEKKCCDKAKTSETASTK